MGRTRRSGPRRPRSLAGRQRGEGWAACRALAATLLVLALSACATSRAIPPEESCPAKSRYFPSGIFPEAYPASDAKRRKWYAAPLARLGEPQLFCGPWRGEAYRLIWLHDFARPVVIRITRHGGTREAMAFQLSGTGKGDPGVTAFHAYKRLSAADWERLQAALRRSRFWLLPTSGNMYGIHGEQWVVEGRRGDTYHVVDRWSPRAGAYRDLGVLFFDLVGWRRPDSSRD